MPAAVKYVPPTDKGRGIFGEAWEREYNKRKEAYETALRYYNGEPDSPYIPDEDEPDYDPTIDNVTVNLAKMTGDRTTSFLWPDLPDIQIDPNSLEDTPEEAWIKNDFLPDNGGLASLVTWALRGFLAGHTFLWIKNARPIPRMIVLHPLAVSTFWSADDTSEVLWYEMRYLAQGQLFIRDFVKQKNGTWKIYLYETVPNERSRVEEVIEQIGSHGGTFSTHTFDLQDFGSNFKQVGKPAIHSSKIPPILDTPHLPDPDDYYGQGEFTQKDLQDIINRIMSERNRIIRENAEPIDFLTGASVDEVEGAGNLRVVESAQARVTRLALTGDLAAISGTLDKLMEMYLAVARTVILKGEAKDLQRVTNAAVRTLFLDALAKNEVLRSVYGRSLSMACKVALEMAYTNGDLDANPVDLVVRIKFAQPLPVDKTEIANQNALALAGGYRSRITASREMGDDPAFEAAAIEEDKAKDLERQEAQLVLVEKHTPEPATPAKKPAPSN